MVSFTVNPAFIRAGSQQLYLPRPMQAPPQRMQSETMNADPSPFDAAAGGDLSAPLSPGGGLNWWDDTVNWVQSHVPETILGVLGTAGAITLVVLASKGKLFGKKDKTTTSPVTPSSNAPSPSRSPSSGNPMPPSEQPPPVKMSDDDFLALEKQYNKLVYGHENPEHGKRRLGLWGGAVAGVGLAIGGTAAALASPIILPSVLVSLFGGVTSSSVAAFSLSSVAGSIGALGGIAITEKGLKLPPNLSKHFMNTESHKIINEYHQQIQLRK